MPTKTFRNSALADWLYFQHLACEQPKYISSSPITIMFWVFPEFLLEVKTYNSLHVTKAKIIRKTKVTASTSLSNGQILEEV